jgi:hypothetical protein
VPPLLDVEDIVEYDNPDPMSIMTYVSQLYHVLPPIKNQKNRKNIGAVQSLIYCSRGDKPVERENPFRKEMLNWKREKEMQVRKMNVEKDLLNNKTIKGKPDSNSLLYKDISRLKSCSDRKYKQTTLQSKYRTIPTYPKPYQPITVRDTTSLISQTSQYLQTARCERKAKSQEQDNHQNTSMFNFLSTSAKSKEKKTHCESFPLESHEDQNENKSQNKINKQYQTKKKCLTRKVNIKLSIGSTGNIFESKFKENQKILKFSLPFF